MVNGRPEKCLYCDGQGNGPGVSCGFCDKGIPLDTQKDWDDTWGRIFKLMPLIPGSEKLDP